MNMDISIVKKEIDIWITDFLAKPNENLNNWCPCPYAQTAINKNSYKVFLGSDIHTDINAMSNHALKTDEVVILAYDDGKYPDADKFFDEVRVLNDSLLAKNNLIALGDHPAATEEVNGVCFNQGKYVLVLIQNLSDLNQKSKKVAKSGFYNGWPEEYLLDIFQHRVDPR
jgi:hypothetical protein